jgi:proteasome lid subunit RPN8/RPN11
MKADGFSVVGWYHSHPSREASPTVNDIMQQINYQESLQIKGGVEPCVGLIVGKLCDM